MAAADNKKSVEFDETKIKQPFFETSTFEVLYPRHRRDYIKSVESFAIKACEQKKIHLEVDSDACTLRVSTTGRTRDPYIIVRAYEMIQLLGKGVLLEKAMSILDDWTASEILPVKLLCATEKVFERRKHRIMNPKVLKSLELVTKTHVSIGSKSISIVGDYRGVHEAKNVIVQCFENVHPAFVLKELIAKKKLLKSECEGDWDRFLPNIKKTHSKKKKMGREKGGLPEEIRERKEDTEMETGEYFSKPENVERMREREERSRRREEKRLAKRMAHEVPEEE